ncbi:flagellar filament capping protein FliD [Diaphorobacter sp.]|uniref:flagellar filament capping protein FliD n=1 Tax=Diaphorobacter sp. TaxID=1934310 RepID=UPI002583F7B2|nr:flagellar filament capping protein FliD [Diaphorobacter sp.]
MAGISSPGVGSGLNVQEIVSQMMSLERRPLQLLQAKASGIDTKISSFGQIKSAMSALHEAARNLTSVDTWRSKQITTGDKTAVTGAATSTAAAANFSLEVQSLARGQSLASGTFASGATMGAAGQITLQKGRWDASGTGFTAGSSSPVTLSISATDTLSDVAAKITQSGSGITAVVVKGAQGDQLLVRGNETGTENGFSMSASGGGALSGLAYDQNGQTMTRTAAAANAEFTIDGLAVTSATNTAQDVVPGVTLNLLRTTTAPVEVSVGTDKDALKDKVKAFQEAFNKLNSLLGSLSAYDAGKESGEQAPLLGESVVRSLQNTLRGMVQQTLGDGSSLTSIGLEMKLDGGMRNPSLMLDTKKLDAALSDPVKLENLLAGDGATEGLISRVRDFAFAANSVDGDLSTRTKGLESTKKSNQSAIEAMDTRLQQRQANMLKQYQALDAKMAGMSSLGSFISAQVGQWNKG